MASHIQVGVEGQGTELQDINYSAFTYFYRAHVCLKMKSFTSDSQINKSRFIHDQKRWSNGVVVVYHQFVIIQAAPLFC